MANVFNPTPKKAKKSKSPIITGETALDLRKRLNLNQQQFWSKLGVTQSGGSRYESGRNVPAPVRKLLYVVYIADLMMSAAEMASFDSIK